MPLRAIAVAHGRAHGNLRHQARCQARRVGDAGACLPFAPGRHGHINGQHQRLEPGSAGAVKHILADAFVTRRIHLEPGILPQNRGDIFG